MNNRKVAIYCRVDRGGNTDARGIALAGQRDQLERYAIDSGLTIAGYYEDDGYTGYDMERPSLMRLMKDYEAGGFDAVLVVKRDRLYRGYQWAELKLPFDVMSLNPLECE